MFLTKLEDMSEIINILNNRDFTKENIAHLIRENNSELRDEISKQSKKIASKVRSDFHNSEKTIKISNYCSVNCSFCESQIDNNRLNRFRLNREEIIEKVLLAYKSGCESILIHSGYDNFYNTDRIAYILYSIKKKANIKITLSLGLRKKNEYKEWKIAGADTYFLTFVTKNNQLYKQSNSLGSFEKRVEHIEELKKLGYSVGTGSVLGLKNETIDSISEDILFIKSIDTDFIDFCKFNNNKTTIDNITRDELTKRCVEVARIVISENNVRLNNLTLFMQ